MTAEEQRAQQFRDTWDARIAYRFRQLRALSGSTSARRALQDNYRPVYDPSNYIDGIPDSGGFMTPLDVDCKEGQSSASIRLPARS